MAKCSSHQQVRATVGKCLPLSENPQKCPFPWGGIMAPTDCMIPWAHPSLHPKRHLDRFSLFGTVHAPYEQTDTCTDRPHFKGNNISRAVLCFAMRPIDKFVFRSHVRIYANERTAFLFAIVLACRQCFDTVVWVWYGMVNVDLYSAVITKVSNALNTPVSGEKPGFQTLSKGLVVLLCSEIVRQRVPDHGAVHSECSASDSG